MGKAAAPKEKTVGVGPSAEVVQKMSGMRNKRAGKKQGD